MTTDHRPEVARDGRVPDQFPPGLPYQDTAAFNRIATRSAVRGELWSLVLCGPAALIVLVLVARHGWPVWWLVIAGMLLAWAGDAAWNLVAAAVDTMVARRTAAGEPPPPAGRGGDHR